MTKRAASLFLLLIFILFTPGCAQKEYTALLCGFCDCVSDIDLVCEYDVWNQGTFQDDSAPKEVTVTIQGKTVTGYYDYSSCVLQSNYISHRYIGYEPFVMFDVDSDNNVVFFSMIGSDDGAGEPLTEPQCQAVAKAFLLEHYTDDLSAYRITDTLTVGDRYAFTFTKYIDGYATADSAYVSVNTNGCVECVSSHMLGRINSKTKINFDMDAVEQAIFSKLDTMYADVKDRYAEITYTVTDTSVTVLRDGTQAVYCTVDIECYSQTDTGSQLMKDHTYQFIVQ